jgi:hypothetical protein
MATKFGFESFNTQLNTTNQGNVFNALASLAQTITAVRVKSIVLSESHPRFKELGEWNGLGTIEFQAVDNPQESVSYSTAVPLFPNAKTYPLINEIVFLITLPDNNIGELPSSSKSYYLSVVALWNHPHHNAYPTNPNTPPPSQQKDYTQTQAGSVRRVTDQSTEIYLGNTFKERSNIHPLLPFEGDVIQEGRWGNSIRLGSTVKKRPNNWSAGDSINGDPIIILRNGQSPNASNEGWIPITEDINTDLSSIYATSTQQIPLNASSTSYVSYKSNKPTIPNQYSGNQLILNSGRLVFNSTKDHILLSSKQSVNLNAVSSVNIDAPSTIIQSNNVYLGSKDATQPVLLGNTTVKLLNQLITSLNSFMTICSTVVSTAPGVPLGPLNMAASQMMTTLNQLQANLEGTKSKYVKTS